MPMNMKTRRYFQLIQDLNAKKRQQLSENVKLVGDLPQQLVPGAPTQQEPETKLRDYVQISDEELKKRLEDREKMVSPLDLLAQQEAEESSEEGWVPFGGQTARRSKL